MIDLEKAYDIRRYDFSGDRSLRPHSAADEYLLYWWNDLAKKPDHLAIYNDRFGYMTCHLSSFDPVTILTSKGQQKAIDLNLKTNVLKATRFYDPLSTLEEEAEVALIKAPKSLALLELFLQQIIHNSKDNVTVAVGFMTRHFSPKLLQLAEKYFENVEQSRAVKKARIITLSKKKKVDKLDLIDVLSYNDQKYKQYWGVFSAKHIDYATQYFLQHLDLDSISENILDLAAGNGVIAKEIMTQLPDAKMHLLDDFYLAVESAKLNISGENITHHYDNDLSSFEDGFFDLIVTNPPFHIEYEISRNIPLQLFKECFRCLKTTGSLQIVANRHLNYLTQLLEIFSTVEILAENEKFIIYKCLKKGL